MSAFNADQDFTPQGSVFIAPSCSFLYCAEEEDFYFLFWWKVVCHGAVIAEQNTAQNLTLNKFCTRAVYPKVWKEMQAFSF